MRAKSEGDCFSIRSAVYGIPDGAFPLGYSGPDRR
jgi:hypothetical protein